MALIFGNITCWENDEAVKQILVFPSETAQRNYVDALPDQPLTVGGYKDENSIGAIFKLRAVMDNKKKWVAVVRCGFTAEVLFESSIRHETPERAFLECIDWLRIDNCLSYTNFHTLEKSLLRSEQPLREKNNELPNTEC